MSITAEQAKEIQSILHQARNGSATLVQLAHAHGLAEAGGLNAVVGEIRQHMAPRITPPRIHVGAKEILLGIVSGLLTAYVLEGVSHGKEKGF